ncbi:unnamed protein product [Dicrocoelium dendriticum]|nr:unnamed protein product [Dicrocoelium dendriticum]
MPHISTFNLASSTSAKVKCCSSGVTFSSSGPEVTRACLPNRRTILKPGTKCYAVGWGEINSQIDAGSNNTQGSSLFTSRQSEFGRESRQTKEDIMEVVEMHEVSLTVLSSNKCRAYNNDLQEETTICAGSVGKDTCYGDSGGGLYCRLPNSKIWYIAGVTSFGDPRWMRKTSRNLHIRHCTYRLGSANNQKLDIEIVALCNKCIDNVLHFLTNTFSISM